MTVAARRTVVLPSLALGLLVGCTDAQQQSAEDLVAERARDAKVSCTGAAKVGYLREIETDTFLCIARRGASNCDHYRVVVHERGARVQLVERGGDCVLPAS